MILHKCHKYYEFSDDLAQLRNDIAKIKRNEVPDGKEYVQVSRIAQDAHELLAALRGVSPTVLELIRDLGQHYSGVALGIPESQINGDLE